MTVSTVRFGLVRSLMVVTFCTGAIQAGTPQAGSRPTAVVQLRSFPAEFKVPADVFMPASQSISLTPPASGTIERIKVHVGRIVERDQTLAVLRTRSGERVSLYALYGGRIKGIAARTGARVVAETSVFQLDRLKADWIIGHVSHSLAKRLHPGLSARVAGTDLVGTVEESGSEPEPDATTVTVACLVPTEAGHLPKGRKLPLMIETPGKTEKAVGIPLSAVTTIGRGHFVHVKRNGSFVRTRVELRRRSHGWVEVVAGLKFGERIANGN